MGSLHGVLSGSGGSGNHSGSSGMLSLSARKLLLKHHQEYEFANGLSAGTSNNSLSLSARKLLLHETNAEVEEQRRLSMPMERPRLPSSREKGLTAGCGIEQCCVAQLCCRFY